MVLVIDAYVRVCLLSCRLSIDSWVACEAHLATCLNFIKSATQGRSKMSTENLTTLRLKAPSRVSRAARKITNVRTLQPLHGSETVNRVEKLQLPGESSQWMRLDWLQLIGFDPSRVPTSVSPFLHFQIYREETASFWSGAVTPPVHQSLKQHQIQSLMCNCMWMNQRGEADAGNRADPADTGLTSRDTPDPSQHRSEKMSEVTRRAFVA